MSRPFGVRATAGPGDNLGRQRSSKQAIWILFSSFHSQQNDILLLLLVSLFDDPRRAVRAGVSPGPQKSSHHKTSKDPETTRRPGWTLSSVFGDDDAQDGR